MTCSGFLCLRSGSGAQVSEGKWSEGSMILPSFPIIGPSGLVAPPWSVGTPAGLELGFKTSYESGPKGTPLSLLRSSDGSACG